MSKQVGVCLKRAGLNADKRQAVWSERPGKFYPDAKRPQWAENMGSNFHTELKLTLITESYSPQFSCDFKTTIKV